MTETSYLWMLQQQLVSGQNISYRNVKSSIWLTFHVTPIDLCIIFQCNLYISCIMSCGKKCLKKLFHYVHESATDNQLIAIRHSRELTGSSTMTIRGRRTQPLFMMVIQIAHKQERGTHISACTAAIDVSKQ